MDDIRIPVPAGSTRFMDQLRADMRARGYAFPTERTYLHWIKRFIIFNQRRHPIDLGQTEIEGFLNYLALGATVSPSTQRTARTALNALMYLYTKFLGREPAQLQFQYARVKDINFELNTVTVREGKGGKDRTTILPNTLKERLRTQIDRVVALHVQDLADGFGEVYLPHALQRKYPAAARSPGWQYL